MTKTLCIYHDNCADGLLAAWAVKKALGDEVEFAAANYGDPLPKESCPTCKGTGSGDYSCSAGCTDCLGTGELAPLYLNRNVLIVDFSYPLSVLRAMAQEARSVLVLDHHKTAQEDLAELPRPTLDGKEWFHYWSDKGSNHISRDHSCLSAIFDLSRSGAGITWDYLHPDKPRPRIIDLVEDRDLWKFKFGDETRAFHAVLASYDWTDREGMFDLLDQWESYTDDMAERFLFEGSAILRAHRIAVASAVAASRRTIKIAGHVVPCASVPPSMASDAGHLLCRGEKCKYCANAYPGPCTDCMGTEIEPNSEPLFSVTYHDGSDGKRHFSLRSPEGGADVGEIAKNMAANFNFLSVENFKDFKYAWKGRWSGGGHAHAAGFDAPLGWEGE